jgi:hypothetical protein
MKALRESELVGGHTLRIICRFHVPNAQRFWDDIRREHGDLIEMDTNTNWFSLTVPFRRFRRYVKRLNKKRVTAEAE